MVCFRFFITSRLSRTKRSASGFGKRRLCSDVCRSAKVKLKREAMGVNTEATVKPRGKLFLSYDRTRRGGVSTFPGARSRARVCAGTLQLLRVSSTHACAMAVTLSRDESKEKKKKVVIA